jgi:hypothetical protein
VKFDAPPSGDLQYDTFYNGMQNMIGTIHWRNDGRTYDLSVSMPVPFIGPFTYRSEGRIDTFGVAPDRYVEQRGKRPEDIAIFNREIHQVVFTRTPNNAPLPDGVQDRFSMLMQLSGLVRGNPVGVPAGRHAAVLRDRQQQRRDLADRGDRRRGRAHAGRHRARPPLHAAAAPRRRHAPHRHVARAVARLAARAADADRTERRADRARVARPARAAAAPAASTAPAPAAPADGAAPDATNAPARHRHLPRRQSSRLALRNGHRAAVGPAPMPAPRRTRRPPPRRPHNEAASISNFDRLKVLKKMADDTL